MLQMIVKSIVCQKVKKKKKKDALTLAYVYFLFLSQKGYLLLEVSSEKRFDEILSFKIFLSNNEALPDVYGKAGVTSQ